MPIIYHKVWACSCILQEKSKQETRMPGAMSSRGVGISSASKLHEPKRRANTAPSTPSHYGSIIHSRNFGITAPRLRPKLKNNFPAHVTRNKSNILPPLPQERGVSTRRIARPRQPPSAVGSEVFQNQRVSDLNNNPTIGRQFRGRRRGPNHQSSSIFLFDRDVLENNENIPPPPTSRRWPWQERALQSMIFNQPEEKQITHRSYNWDQRRCTSLFQDDPNPTSLPVKNVEKGKKWPWQVRARESLIFKELSPPPYKGMYYPWDQRQSALTDHESRFEGISRYMQDYLGKNLEPISSIPTAGMTCYGTLQPLRGKKMLTEKNQETIPPSTNEVINEPKENLPDRKKTFTVLQDRTNNTKEGESSLSSQLENMTIKENPKPIAQILDKGEKVDAHLAKKEFLSSYY